MVWRPCGEICNHTAEPEVKMEGKEPGLIQNKHLKRKTNSPVIHLPLSQAAAAAAATTQPSSINSSEEL